MTKEYKKGELFRLAAVLYADNNYEVSSRVIHRKVVDSALLDCQNKDMTFHQIIDYIEETYSLIISEDEIEEIIKKYPDSFLIDYGSEQKTLCLSQKRKILLESKVEQNNIETYITEFASNHEDQGFVKKALYDFLYHMFSVNTASFQKLIDYKKDISQLISLQDSKFTQDTIEVINNFLNWDNSDKNKAIFDISSYALEFCLLTNKKGSSNLRLNNLKNKHFYLDTNVIYRAIGINGLDRKKRTSTFLNKFKEAKEDLFITRITDEEFKNSIKFYIDKLKGHNNQKIKSQVFLEFRSLKDIHSYYHLWKKNKVNANLELFESFVLSEYNSFIDKFNIVLDYKTPYDPKDHDSDEYIKNLASDISKSKPDWKRGNYGSIFNDAENVYWIEKKRKGKVENIFDTKYFFISSDNQLRKWDYYRGFQTPIVLLPSQWMSILLRYFDRTKDDYSSFVSFLNLRNNEKVIEGEKLNLILLGISEMTSDVEQQRHLVSNIIEKEFDNIIKNSSNEEIISKSKEYAKTQLEEKIENLAAKVNRLEEETTHKQRIIGSAIKSAKTKKYKNKELEDKLNEKDHENKSLSKENQELKVAKDFSTWRKMLWVYIPSFILIICFYVGLIFLDDNDYNFGKKVIKFIDSQESDSSKDLLKGLLYAPITLLAILAPKIWSRIFQKGKKKIELLEKYN